MLAVIETHPIQYHAPVYRAVVERGVPVTAIYGSDFSVAGYRDREFNATFAWDVDLLAGYESRFLGRVARGGAPNDARVSARGIGDALTAVAPDAVLIVGYSPAFHRDAWRAAWRQGRPILFRGEVNDAARDRRPVRAGVRRAALSLAYRSCHRCLYIGEEARAHFLRHGVDERRLVFSPYCVDDRPFEASDEARDATRQATRAALGVPADASVVLFSGKLSHRKGVDLLVEAVRGLPDAERSRTALVFVGDGELRTRLATAAAVSPAVTARFTGFVNQRALSPYFHAADVLALPSRHSETWGLVVNEALLHGLPVVVSDRVGCHPDLVEDGRTGVVFGAGDPRALRDALTRALGLPRTVAMRAACRTLISRYSVGAAADGIVDAYRAVAASRGQVA